MEIKLLDQLIDLIDNAIDENADNTITTGNIIASGYKEDIDRYRDILEKGHQWIGEYKQELILATGIKNLRIKYTNNNGYFIEISKNQTDTIPDNFIHTQTLVSASRYTTSDLQKFQRDLNEASSNMSQLEYDYFIEIRNNIMCHFDYLYNISRKIEKLDFFSNAAHISQNNGYITPKIADSYMLDIVGGKHPVMQQVVPDFISNNVSLSKKEFIHVITGPNMGGKSTFLRQNALLILLSHMGFDIPAVNANIPLTDRIFSRVGSGDNLFLGQSTFMVEMQEIAYILRNSTNRSFVIIDEIGRGTSTYDGMSLAWSILKHNHNAIKAKTLFATHYHEIIDFSSELSGVGNYSVAVGENNQSIVFLRKIIPGGIKKSYGIEVAKLAGIPDEVLSGAHSTLRELQSESSFQQLSIVTSTDDTQDVGGKKTEKYEEFLENISTINIDNITPLQALTYIQQFQEQVKKMK